jgi:AmiR/NasT family two-component response regulator
MQTRTDRSPDVDAVRADELSLARQVDFLAEEVHEQERQIEDLQLALHHSRTVGVALGILMTTGSMAQSDALGALSSVSRRLNRRIADVADHVAATGALPDRL